MSSAAEHLQEAQRLIQGVQSNDPPRSEVEALTDIGTVLAVLAHVAIAWSMPPILIIPSQDEANR